MILREEKPSADSCGDSFLEERVNGFLPVGCGAEPVFNFSWEREVLPFGSGDGKDGIDYPRPVTTEETTVIPRRALLSTASHHQSTKSAGAVGEGIVPVIPNRSVSRHPPRFTPSPEIRHSSFQHLLRIHLNTFNHRLSMLESNTLDMKDSIQIMEDQQKHLSSHLKDIITMSSIREKEKKVTELERSYTDMEARLSRLEGRLEILIDGFTALAQEMNKMKRVRHIARSPQEKKLLPPHTTALASPLYSTPQPLDRVVPTETPLTSRATVPQSIPTPAVLLDKHTHSPRRGRKVKLTTTETARNARKTKEVIRSTKSHENLRSTVKPKTTLGKPKTVAKSTSVTAKPNAKRPQGRRSSVTAKHISQPRKTKSKEAKQEAAITKFQLEPPSHKSRPATTPQLHKHSHKSNKKDSAEPTKSKGRHTAFRSDAPVKNKPQDGSKNSSKPNERNSKPHEKRKKSAKDTVTTPKPAKVTVARRAKTTVKRTGPARVKADTVKKSSTRGKSTPAPIKTKTSKRKVNSSSGALDLLRILNKDYRSVKHRKTQEDSFHIVLGKLAIPIKIIPDY